MKYIEGLIDFLQTKIINKKERKEKDRGNKNKKNI